MRHASPKSTGCPRIWSHRQTSFAFAYDLAARMRLKIWALQKDLSEKLTGQKLAPWSHPWWLCSHSGTSFGKFGSSLGSPRAGRSKTCCTCCHSRVNLRGEVRKGRQRPSKHPWLACCSGFRELRKFRNLLPGVPKFLRPNLWRQGIYLRRTRGDLGAPWRPGPLFYHICKWFHPFFVKFYLEKEYLYFFS